MPFAFFVLQAQQPTPPALTEQQVDVLLEQYKDIIDNATDNSTLQQIIANAEKQAEEFTQPEVLELLSQPDGTRIQEQLKFNQQLLTSITLSQDLGVQVGIYNEDVIRTGLMGAAWGLEWAFHNYLSDLLVDRYLELLIANTDQICDLAAKNPTPDQQTLVSPKLELPNILPFFPIINRSMALVIAGYATSSIALAQAQAYYLPEGTLPPSSNDSARPMSITSFIPFNLFKLATPQTWTTYINDWFIDNGWMETWTQSMYWAWTKELFVTMMWLRGFIKHYADHAFNSFVTENLSVIAPMLKQIMDGANTLRQAQGERPKNGAHGEPVEPFERTTLRTLLASEMNITLNTWVMIKSAQASFWHSIINVLVATPAWKKIISKTYQLYQAVYTKPKGS